MRNVLLILLLVVALLAAGILFVAYSGVVDVSATGSESAPVAWFLETTRERAIESRLGAVEVPELGTPRQLELGLVHYHEMCVTCHGAPGIDRSEIGEGLSPPPPDLASDHFDEEEAAESYWVVKHGIRMTGMPAFGPTHGEEELWAVVAVLAELGDMSAEDYAARLRAAGLEVATGHAHGEQPAPGEEPAAKRGHAHGAGTEDHSTGDGVEE